jgi:hypothetical protein
MTISPRGTGTEDEAVKTAHSTSRFQVKPTAKRLLRMGRQVGIVLYVAAMVAIIVGVDFAFLKNRFWARLIANIAIVLVFGTFYLMFLN